MGFFFHWMETMVWSGLQGCLSIWIFRCLHGQQHKAYSESFSNKKVQNSIILVLLINWDFVTLVFVEFKPYLVNLGRTVWYWNIFVHFWLEITPHIRSTISSSYTKKKSISILYWLQTTYCPSFYTIAMLVYLYCIIIGFLK